MLLLKIGLGIQSNHLFWGELKSKRLPLEKKNTHKKRTKIRASVLLTHCRLNELPHTIYWKILISILGLYQAMWFKYSERKMVELFTNNLQTAETLVRCHILQCPIWVFTVFLWTFNPCPAEPGYTLFCKQIFWRSQLIWICTVCHQVCKFIATIWIK